MAEDQKKNAFKSLDTEAVLATLKKSWIFTVIIGFGVGLAIVGLLQPDPSRPLSVSMLDYQDAMKGSNRAVPEPQKLATHTVTKLQRKFDQIGYSMDAMVENGFVVPRIWPDAIPSDMDSIQQAGDRKDLFVKMILPLVLLSNERIERDRQHLLSLKEQLDSGETLAQADQNWLDRMTKSYRLKEFDMDELLSRVDVVPVSLALAQAAIESGWGTSRFARRGNALFGQWTFSSEDKGIVPEGRETGKNHRIRAFDSPLDSVLAYVHNLNTHRAYSLLRKLRTEKRASGGKATGIDLTYGLEHYSEKGMEYVYLLQNIINSNDMPRFDEAKLGGRRLAQSSNGSAG